ncbi:MAG: dihydropteroate synthase [Rickettsiales bacterium]
MTKLVGILNITPNSFSDSGQNYSPSDALAKINQLFTQGADYVDIGAEATSYGAQLLTHEQEWARLEPILTQIKPDRISIDTYHPQTAAKAIAMGFTFINDVAGGKTEMLKVIAAHTHVKYVLMHSLVVPADRNIRVKNISEVYSWAEANIERCLSMGIKPHQIIFDPGLGFTTHPEQSLQIIKSCTELKKFGVATYIGHSRKTVFETLTSLPPSERDIETLAASLYMFGKVDYLRVHNVEMHARAFKVWDRLMA